MNHSRTTAGLVAVVAAIGLATACGRRESVAAPIVSPRSAAALAGTWLFSHPENDTCAGANGNDMYLFHVDSSGVMANGLMTISTTWTDAREPQDAWPLDGYMDLVSGQVVLNFWLVVNLAGQEFDGTFDVSGNVGGTLTDPKPGFLPQFVIGTCKYPMSGQRIGG
jgi:hypothetical protein